MTRTKENHAVKPSKEVLRLVRQINRLNRGWVKNGCWSIVKEEIRTNEETGKKTYRETERVVKLQKKTKLPKKKRHHGFMPDSAKLHIKLSGQPGSSERVEAIKAAYEAGEDPFNLQDDHFGNALTIILSKVAYIPDKDGKHKLGPVGRGNEHAEVVDKLCQCDGGEPDIEDIGADV